MRFIVDKEDLEAALAQADRARSNPTAYRVGIHKHRERLLVSCGMDDQTAARRTVDAKLCLDSYMKNGCLLRLLEWHARATHGWDYDTWHNGRFLEKWADPRAVEDRAPHLRIMMQTMRGALLATMALFRWLATRRRKNWATIALVQGAQRVTEWVRQHLAEA
jgi:hypothetical protein